MPALPLDEAGKYVAGAYVVFVVLILVYVAIMAAKLQRIERELRELAVCRGSPLNFLSVRLAESLVHPRVFATTNGGLPGSMMLTFLVCLTAIALLWVTLVKLELTAKSASGQVKRLRRALDAPPSGSRSRVAPEVS